MSTPFIHCNTETTLVPPCTAQAYILPTLTLTLTLTLTAQAYIPSCKQDLTFQISKLKVKHKFS